MPCTTARFLTSLAMATALAACATTPSEHSRNPVLRVIGINDFHGNIEPVRRPLALSMSDGEAVTVASGGAAWVAGAIEDMRAQSEYSMVISAGDLIGGSPLVSSLFLDEPTIGVMNRIGLDFNAVGNHEFDRGWRELIRMQQGGCKKYTLREPCAVEEEFKGSEFTFLGANVLTQEGRTLFPAYGIKTFGEGDNAFSVAVIGLTLEDTPNLVTPSGVAGLQFRQEAPVINALIPQIRERGIETIILAIHQGLYQNLPYDRTGCDGIEGPLLDILADLDPAIDLVLSGHTHQTYICDYSEIDAERDFLVTSAGLYGSYLTDIALTIDRKTGDVRSADAHNRVIQSVGTDRGGTKIVADPRFGIITPSHEVAEYVASYVAAASEATNRPVGRISGEARRHGPATEETQLGNLIADGQLAATRNAGAQIALMNTTGIRAALIPAPDGTVTFGDIYTVQPFGNTLITRTYSGAQLLALLEQQFDSIGGVQVFSVSEGLAFSYDMARPEGQRIVAATLDGQPIDPERQYRITMNSFLAAGGDSFTVFTQGTDSTTGPVDLDAFEAHLASDGVTQLPETGRITAIAGP